MKLRKMFKVNFRIAWTAFMLLLSIAISAQEICNNGIDDDGDSLIDLNDNECECANVVPLTTIMGNPCRTLNLTLDVPGATSYQWYKDGVAITSEMFSTIAITRFAPTGEGTYTVVAMTATGCVSSEPYLAERDEFETDLGEIFICEGDTLFLNGFAFFRQGKQKFTTKTIEFGCDSTVIFEIFIDDPAKEIINETRCTGSTYVNGNISTNQSGIYVDTLRTASGCDSLIRTVNLTFEDLMPQTFDAEICSGETYNFYDISETTAGEYSTTISSANGCDTTYIVNLTVLQPVTEMLDASVCQGGLYEFGDISATTAGTYTTILQSANNCDSVEVTVNLTLTPPEEQTETQTICQGLSYDWRGNTYDTAGTYTDLESAAGVCDILHVLELTVADPTVIEETRTICEGEFTTLGDFTTDKEGTYDVTVQSVGGCDQDYQLTVIVSPTTYGEEETVLCNGDTYTLFDLVAMAPGSYQANTVNHLGCDSIINVNILASAIDPTIEEGAICPGESYMFQGEEYDTPGSYSVTLTNQYNCDSIVTLELAVSSALDITENFSICSGDTLRYHDIVATTSGTYNTQITGAGCDSLITLNLEVLEQSYADLEREICFGDTLYYNDIAATEEGSYMTIMPNHVGCDSIVTVALNVIFNDPTAFTVDICEGDVYVNEDIAATVAGRYETVLTSSTGCDSTIVIDLQVSPLNQAEYEFQICPGESLTFYDDVIEEEGSYTRRFANEFGCDSLVTFNVAFDASLGDIEVEPEYIVNRGSSIDIEPLFVDAGFVSFMWQDEDREIMSIEKELTNFTPTEDTYIYFVATNANGCEVEQRVRIDVELVVNIFIPNAITPDSDTYNSFFNIRTNESVVAMTELNIYDRWGELMYTSSHQGSFDSYFGWNGKYKNRAVLPGVYTYAAVFEIIDGTTVKKSGGVTVIR